MNESIVLKTLLKALVSGMFLAALFLFFRGHNAPGGGFIAGLVGAGAASLVGFTFGVSGLRAIYLGRPVRLMILGLGCAYLSALWGTFANSIFFTGLWNEFAIVGKLGTPVLFDLGVFLVVIGIFLQILKKLGIKNP